MNLTDYMAGEGKDFTNPGLDLKDFIGTSFTTAPDGKLYQLPDQQFANLYWFRADLFARKDLQDKFKAKYGYELGRAAELERLRRHRRLLQRTT
jgi:glycerol transport system substrate-binding protein